MKKGRVSSVCAPVAVLGVQLMLVVLALATIRSGPTGPSIPIPILVPEETLMLELGGWDE